MLKSANLEESSAGASDPVLDPVRAALTAAIEADAMDLPLLPQVAGEVLSLSSDTESNAAQLCDLIHRDQGLAGHLLRISNSAALGGRTPIISLQQAIARLGGDRLREITLSICVQTRLFQSQRRRGTMEGFWSASVVTAGFAKEIARTCRQNLETAFLCGLLHNVGKPVLLQQILDLEEKRGEEMEEAAVARLVDEFHVRVGARIAERWELPDPVQAAIRHHRLPERAPENPAEARITCLASLLAMATLDGTPEGTETVRSHPVVADLNLYPDDLENLIGRGESILEYLESMAL